MPKKYEFHPITHCWPMMPAAEFKRLVESIRKNGLRERIWLHPDDDTIIDGRNRYNACIEAGVDPKFYTWDGEGSLVDFVFDKNDVRRQLTASQRAMAATSLEPFIAAEIEATKGIKMAANNHAPGGACAAKQAHARTERRDARKEAAEKAHVSENYAGRAKTVVKADPKVAEEVMEGKKTLPQAEEELRKTGKLPPKKPPYRPLVSTAPPKPAPAPPVASGGKSRVNGHPTKADPIAAVLKSLPAHVKPDVSGDDDAEKLDDVVQQKEEEKAIQQDQDTDESWLESMPLYSKLEGVQLKTFCEDALNWRVLTRERDRWKKAIAERLNRTRRKGPWLKRMRNSMAIAPPDQWQLCPPLSVGEGAGCGGKGSVPGMTGCPKCSGAGFILKDYKNPK